MSDYTWDDFPIHEETPTVEADIPRNRVVRINGIRYLELPDNGYELLLAWVAGPARACRTADRTQYTVTITVRSHRGHSGQGHPVSTGPRTEEDWKIVDQMVNGSLRDAGVPPRPRGYTWYIELREPLMPADLWGAVHVDVEHGVPAHPERIRIAMADAIERLCP